MIDTVVAAVERTRRADPTEYIVVWVIAAAVANAARQPSKNQFLAQVVLRELVIMAPIAPGGWVRW